MKYTCSMETVQQNGRFTLFPVNSSLYILFSMPIVHCCQFFTKILQGDRITKIKKKIYQNLFFPTRIKSLSNSYRSLSLFYCSFDFRIPISLVGNVVGLSWQIHNRALIPWDCGLFLNFWTNYFGICFIPILI